MTSTIVVASTEGDLSKMELAEFKTFLKSKSYSAIAEELVHKTSIHAFDSEQAYEDYKVPIKADHPRAHLVSIVGSANWKFSLNPKNNFRVFHRESDIDVAIICAESYFETWEELRRIHRDKYYTLGQSEQLSLRRNGENVYSGFASPKWIPTLTSSLLRDHLKLTDKYSNRAVGFKKVNMMYFRNVAETIDYYVRSIRLANR